MLLKNSEPISTEYRYISGTKKIHQKQQLKNRSQQSSRGYFITCISKVIKRILNWKSCEIYGIYRTTKNFKQKNSLANVTPIDNISNNCDNNSKKWIKRAVCNTSCLHYLHAKRV